MDCIRTTRAMPALALILASTLPLTAWPAGDEPVQVARYSTVAPVPRVAQADPLATVVTVVFPDELTTVNEALHHLLRRSGYRLAAPEASDPAFAGLADEPLPEVHRRLGPITVMHALNTLAGPAWHLAIDPVHRLVSFELAERYAALRAPAQDPTQDPSGDSPDDSDDDCDAYESWIWC